jgi:hypothetical protein
MWTAASDPKQASLSAQDVAKGICPLSLAFEDRGYLDQGSRVKPDSKRVFPDEANTICRKPIASSCLER